MVWTFSNQILAKFLSLWILQSKVSNLLNFRNFKESQLFIETIMWHDVISRQCSKTVKIVAKKVCFLLPGKSPILPKVAEMAQKDRIQPYS